MSDPGAALLRGVLEAPELDPPRLVYADYLMEKGDPRGEFISVQIQLRQRISPARRARAKKREYELYRAHLKDFSAPAKGIGYRPVFRRGFIDEVTGDAADFAKKGKALMEVEPVRHVRLWNATSKHVDKMLAEGLVGRLATLNLSGGVGADAAKALAASPQLASLYRLNLGGAEIGDEGLVALVGSPHLQATSLSLYENDLTDASIDALCAWPGLAKCTHLYMSRNQFTDKGVATLAGASIGSLKMLSFGGCEAVGDAGALAFATEELASSIHHIEFEYCDLSDAAAEQLRELWGARVKMS